MTSAKVYNHSCLLHNRLSTSMSERLGVCTQCWPIFDSFALCHSYDFVARLPKWEKEKTLKKKRRCLSSTQILKVSRAVPYLLSGETAVKGTNLKLSAGKEDPVLSLTLV